MTTRDTAWPEGTPCWVDVGVESFAKAQAFYSGLFGWEITPGPPELGGYTTCTKDGRAVAGLMELMNPEQPTVWTTYLAVDDLDATLAKMKELGGQMLFDPMTVGELGRQALTADPAGAVVGLWQAGTHPGCRLTDEPGSLTWSENLSRAWRQNKDFYASVFGWKYDDMSDQGFEYATFTVDGTVAGGIGQIGDDWPSEVAPHWNNYFKVGDMASGVERLRELGGTVTREPWETPFGTMAAVTDDQGAAFMLMADNEESTQRS